MSTTPFDRPDFDSFGSPRAKTPELVGRFLYLRRLNWPFALRGALRFLVVMTFLSMCALNERSFDVAVHALAPGFDIHFRR